MARITMGDVTRLQMRIAKAKRRVARGKDVTREMETIARLEKVLAKVQEQR